MGKSIDFKPQALKFLLSLFQPTLASKSMIVLVSLASLLLIGCSSNAIRGYPQRSGEVDARLNSLKTAYFLPTVNVLTTYQGRSNNQKKTYRDEVVYARMMVIDLQYTSFKSAIYSEGIQSNLALEIAGVGIGAAGAVVTGADASRILSALSGGISGTNTAINKNLYYERTMPALIALMDAERKKIQVRIKEDLLKDYDIYSLAQALVDLEAYFQAGSIPGAIASVTVAAGEKQQNAEASLTTLRDKTAVDPAAQKRIEDMLELADTLPNGAAWQILQNPPSQLDQYVLQAVEARLDGTTQPQWDTKLSQNDQNSKTILKFILVLIDDRSEDNLTKWKAAMDALK